MADSSKIFTKDWLIPEIKVGGHIIKNAVVSIVDSENSMMLFGMNDLKKLFRSALNFMSLKSIKSVWNWNF